MRRTMSTTRTGRRTAALIALLALSSGAFATADVTVEDHGDGRFTLSMSLAGTDDPNEGALAIRPTADALCGERFPHFGRHRFESTAALAGQPGAAPPSLAYHQEITCADAPQTALATDNAPVPPAPAAPPTEADARDVRELTIAYLRSKAEGDTEAASAFMSREMAGYTTAVAWTTATRDFATRAGAGADPHVRRITWYDDPAGAPAPGRYAAADYNVAYPSGAFVCGYVMWLRQAAGGYLVVREEQGLATPDDVVGLTGEQLAAMRAQLQCRD
jgi:hypothetical protein